MSHTGDDTSSSPILNSNWWWQRWRRRQKTALRWSPDAWEPVPYYPLLLLPLPLPIRGHISFYGEGNHQSTPPPKNQYWKVGILLWGCFFQNKQSTHLTSTCTAYFTHVLFFSSLRFSLRCCTNHMLMLAHKVLSRWHRNLFTSQIAFPGYTIMTHVEISHTLNDSTVFLLNFITKRNIPWKS